MSAPSPNRPQKLITNTTNKHHIDTNPPPSYDSTTSVEPSRIAVADPTNTASLTPTTDEVLASLTTVM